MTRLPIKDNDKVPSKHALFLTQSATQLLTGILSNPIYPRIESVQDTDAYVNLAFALAEKCAEKGATYTQ